MDAQSPGPVASPAKPWARPSWRKSACVAQGGVAATTAAEDEELWSEELAAGKAPKLGFERFVARTLGRWGNVLARRPWLVVLTTVMLHLALASCVRWATFESDSHSLYIGQKTPISDDRRHSDSVFGANPSPLILVLRSKRGDTDVMTAEFVHKLLRLHVLIYNLRTPYPPPRHGAVVALRSERPERALAQPHGAQSIAAPASPADGERNRRALRDRSKDDEAEGKHDSDAISDDAEAGEDGGDSGFAPAWVDFQDVCARRYVHLRQQSECIVVSPLQLWAYSQEMIKSDTDVARTLSDAYGEHLVDMGGRELRVGDAAAGGRVSGAQALIATYYLDEQLDAFTDGRASAWEAAARREIAAFVLSEGDVHVSTWSRLFNEEEASRFVRNDGYLIAVAFAVVLLYVSLTLSHWGCDTARARYALACSALASSGLALASGLGMAALCSVPITPITPLVCFTLLGVSVDDMIILTDAFDRLAHAQRLAGVRAPPGARVLGGALHEIGGAVTMTTLTTAATFLTGWTCDLPIYAFFCSCAALSMLSLFHIQMTLYAALLLLDARRRHALVERMHRAAEAREAARQADEPPQGSAGHSAVGKRLLFEEQPPQPQPQPQQLHAHERAEGGLGDAAPADAGDARPLLARAHARLRHCTVAGTMHRLGLLTTRSRTRYLVLSCYLSLVLGSLVLAPHVRVGLPQRQTIADDSPIGAFLDDLDEYWSGYAPTNVMLVFRNTNATDPASVRGVQRVIEDVLALPFVLRTQLDWIERFATWCACRRGELGESAPFYGALPPPDGCTIAAFLADGELHETCDGNSRHKSLSPESCVDNEVGFRTLSGGHTCGSAATHCGPGTFGWHTVQRYCPLTCRVCTPLPTAPQSLEKGLAPLPDAQPLERALAPAPRSLEKGHELAPRAPVGGGVGGGYSSGVPFAPREGAKVEVPISALGGKDLTSDVVLQAGSNCTEHGSCILAAHRIVLVVLLPQVYVNAFVQYEALQLPFALHNVSGYAYQVKYEFACMDEGMMRLSVRNLLAATPVIGLCTGLFLEPLIALFAVLAVVSIDVLLFGVMALSGMPINFITLLSLLIALGLAIDYSCHLGHAYQHAHGSRKHKVLFALDTIGISILNAGGSTLLGTLFIAASRSALFRIFFVFVWGTIALGLLCGLVIIPSALASFGPASDPSDKGPWARLGEDEACSPQAPHGAADGTVVAAAWQRLERNGSDDSGKRSRRDTLDPEAAPPIARRLRSFEHGML